MSGRRRTRPADPASLVRRRAAERERERQIAADPSAWGLDREALALAANADVRIVTDAAQRPLRARRQDVFDRLAARGRLGPGAVEAVRRLQGDIAILHRTAVGGGDFTPRVDRSLDPAGFGEAHREAGARIEAVLALTGPASARLLSALCEADVALGAPADWREVVLRSTGESLADAQSAVLRAACENLAEAYRALGRRKPHEP